MSATTTHNGTKTDPVATFPLDSFREAAPHLRRPFTPAAVKFKVQATWPKNSPTGGMIVAYIDARLVVERLNLIIPDRWSDSFEPHGTDLICHLTVDGITRSDIGEGRDWKARYSDALKRAGVKFGIGVPLYAVPKVTLNVGQGLKLGGGDKVTLTADGERMARQRYAAWLDAHGIESFGRPLNHGDVEDAQGDVEVEGETPPATAPEVVTEQDVAALHAAAKGLPVAQIKLAMSSVGVDPPDPFVPAEAFNRVPQGKGYALAQALSGAKR